MLQCTAGAKALCWDIFLNAHARSRVTCVVFVLGGAQVAEPSCPNLSSCVDCICAGGECTVNNAMVQVCRNSGPNKILGLPSKIAKGSFMNTYILWCSLFVLFSSRANLSHGHSQQWRTWGIFSGFFHVEKGKKWNFSEGEELLSILPKKTRHFM